MLIFIFCGGEPIEISVYNSFSKKLLYILSALFTDLKGKTTMLQLYIRNNICIINLP